MEQISFSLNNKTVMVEANPNDILLWVLRTKLGLTGTKYGCGIGFCGSCTILVDGEAMRSCGMAVSEVAGRQVTTIEGLAIGDKLHPVQESFVMHDAQQCGYCTPGMIMNAVGLLNNNPNPSREEIIEGMNDNLCRCGSYRRITNAVESAAKQMNGGSNK
ncbi:(2Fe-2S)-binding protein [Carboxylicivirga sediminis]|uniref:(2Fe-2S)-binding protein n=1 Tax=Carboxylicivirga sediminis TaxID=2006564 RepID=A0A941F384_9BACT|nr:(2Fe-2S)-binding protein [Carboxylicivirga sediminis]MBR8535494.1 (2Fe-2S)-binding protein [Carboxylicivirga sediminis]